MNIAITVESFFDGGAEIFAIRLANDLALHHNIFFIELYPHLTKEKRQLSLLNKSKVSLLQPGQNFIAHFLYNSFVNKKKDDGGKTRSEKLYWQRHKREINLFINNNKIDVVNSHSWDSDVYFAMLKKELKFALVSSFHGHYEFLSDKRNGYEKKTIEALAGIDEVIYTSPKHGQTLDKYEFPVNRRHKIFYGIPIVLAGKVTEYKKGSRLQIVMAARGIKEKGWEEAIQAVLQLNKKYPALLELKLAGESSYLDQLKIKYNDPAIVFLGYCEDVQSIINNAHLGILPTYYIAESLPNTVIEYLSCGKPVIAANVGAISEMICYNSETAGACIDLLNGKVNVACLVDAIEKYIRTPSLVQEDSAIALKAAEKFTMRKCRESYLQVFEAVL